MEINTKSTIITNILHTIAQKTFAIEPLLQLKQKLLMDGQSQQQQIVPQQNQSIPIENIQSQQKEVNLQSNVNNNTEAIVPIQLQNINLQNRQQNSIEPSLDKYKIVTQQSKPISNQLINIQPKVIAESKSKQQQQKIDVNQAYINQPIFTQISSSSKYINQLKQPPFLSNNKNYTQESSERDRTYTKDGKDKVRKLSSQQDSINLDLTQKMKKTNNMTNTYGRVDSLIYSDATLMYSNATGFGQQTGQQSKNSNKKQFNLKSQLNKIEDHGQNAQLSARMQRAQSRQIARLRTDSQNRTDLQINIKTQQDQQDQNIFTTQTYDKKRISRIKELKENKKKRLQKQLKKVNQQLQQLTRKQSQVKSNPKSNNYQSRVKISDNVEAKVKAERLIKNLRYQKKSRHDAHLDELQILDKNINQYMQEIVKERYKNEDRIKQKKKLEIIQRMKKQQIRKIQEQKMKEKNLQFLHQIKTSGSKNNIVPIKSPQQKAVKQIQNYTKQRNQQVHHVPTKQRSHTKKSESIMDQSEMTPQLSRKKALMKRLRNLSIKKQNKLDLYEQVLS